MSQSNNAFFRVGWQFIWVLPAAIISTILVTALYELAIIKNPYGIANPIAYLAMVFGVAPTVIYSIRLGKVRGRVIAFLFGSGITLLCLATAIMIAHRFHPSGQAAGNTIGQFFTAYIKQGIPLFGGTAAVRGGWLIATWILATLGVGFIGFPVALIEASYPFCEHCNNWSRKEVWKYSLENPTDQSLSNIRKERTVASTLAALAGGQHNRTLDYSIRACECGQIATLDLELRKSEERGDHVVDKLRLTPFTLVQVFEFGERRDSRMVGLRPALEVTAEPTEPFDATPKPEGEEYRSFFRWDSKLGASDSYVDNEYTKAMRKRLSSSGHEIAVAALKAQRNRSDFAYVAEACADFEGRPEWLVHWLAQDSDGALPLLIHGINTIKVGWQARGVGFVPKEIDTFWSHLAQARPQLLAAAEALPSDATPWAWLIYLATGAGDDIELAQGYFNEAISRHRTSRIAHSFMIQKLAQKWGGSEQDMLDFARNASASFSSGKHIHVVIPEAHMEVAGQIHRTHNRKASLEYWRSPGVAEELRAANNKCFNSGGFKSSMDTPRTRVYFAYTLWKAGQFDDAAEHLRLIGNSSPWGPFQPNLPFMKDSVRVARKACRVR